IVSDSLGVAGFETPAPYAETAARLASLQSGSHANLDRNPVDLTLAGLHPDILRGAIRTLLASRSSELSGCASLVLYILEEPAPLKLTLCVVLTGSAVARSALYTRRFDRTAPGRWLCGALGGNATPERIHEVDDVSRATA